MSILLSWAFSWYVNNLAMYNTLYGSIGTLIVILLWIYFISFVILIGFELNASIQKAGSNRKIT
jgi:membrane protein